LGRGERGEANVMDASIFSNQEFEDRLRRVREEMRKRGLSVLILTRPQNIYYLSGFRAAHMSSQFSELHALMIPMEGEPRMMTRALEKEIALLQWTKNPALYRDHENPYELLVRIFREGGYPVQSIGIEERFLNVRQFSRMRESFPGAQFLDATGLVERVAAKPSKAESDCMRNAARITHLGFKKGIDEAKEGRYPYQIIGSIHQAMYQGGQSNFDQSLVCVWSGEKGGRMHDTSTTEQIRNGDLVTIEVWGVHNQYKAGAQGSLFVGDRPSKQVQETYRIVADMFINARDAIRPGLTAGEVYEAASRVYRGARGSDYYRRVGGSMGLTVFNVDLVKGNKEVLQPGLCLLIQTLVDDPVLITCASTVMVTEKGYETLTEPLLELRTV
jgi:Xaa-Pro dipeptidase